MTCTKFSLNSRNRFASGALPLDPVEDFRSSDPFLCPPPFPISKYATGSISKTLVTTQSNLDISLLLVLQLHGCTTAKAHTASIILLSLHDSYHYDFCWTATNK